MSKTVIVFSTRFLDPLSKNGLFATNKTERKPFTSRLLADYFWNDIKKNQSLLSTMVLSSDYFAIDALKELPEMHELSQYLDDHKDELKRIIEDNQLELSFSTEDFNWVDTFLYHMTKLPNSLSDLQSKFNNYQLDSLKNKNDSKWISQHLKYDSGINQIPINLDNEDNTEIGPWLASRFSYYKLESNNKNVAVYAVWPLVRPSEKDNNNNYAWIEALKNQFLTILHPKAEELYLILHDEDIERSIFKVLIDEQKNDIAMHIALFEHIDSMGAFLESPIDRSLNGVKSFVENMVMDARKRRLLRNAYDYIKNHNDNQLLEVSKKLFQLDENRYKEIYEDALILSNPGAMTKQYIDKYKLSLISHLNKELRDLLLV